MKKIIYLTVLILFFSCGGKGVEGNVGQIISISAEENLEETEVDYNWIIVNQPDGSLSVSYTHLTLPTKRIV